MTDEECYLIGDKEYPRIRYGDEKHPWTVRMEDGQPLPCHDCRVLPGDYHLPGCDVEECPRCGDQSISCHCD